MKGTSFAQQPAVALAEQRRELYSITPAGVAELNFHPGQAATWNSTARFVLMLSGTQGGKTSFGPWWLWREIETLGGGDYIAATTSFDLFKLKMLPELRKVFEDVLGIGRYHSGMRVLELRDPVTGRFWAKKQDDPMWGRIILRSAEAEGGLESATAKAAWLDEVGQDQWDVNNWNAVQRRLALAEGRILGTTTVYNSGWIKSLWYDPFVNGDPDYDVIQFDSVMNPAFPRKEFERARRTQEDWVFDMFYRGKFSKPKGLIYHAFEDSMLYDVIKPAFKRPREIPRFVGLDFGGANTATIYAYEDIRQSPSVFYIYAEFLEGGKSTAEHVEDMSDRLGDAEDVQVVGGSKSETQWRRDWAANGQSVYEPKVSDVEVGIAAVIELFKTGRIRILRTLEGLKHELATYRRRLNPDGTVSEQIDDKSSFHRLDALRYMALRIVSRDRRSKGEDSKLGKVDDYESRWTR